MSIQTRLLPTNTTKHPGTGPVIPDLCLFNHFDTRRYPYLLSSSASRQNNTQYDILIACPQYLLTLDSGRVLRCTNTDINLAQGFFDTLEQLYQHEKKPEADVRPELPFTGGWFVYLSYEMVEEIEPCLSLPDLPAGQPLAVAARCPAAIIHDKQSNQLIAVAEDGYAYLLDEMEQDYLKITAQLKQKETGEQNEKAIAINSLLEAESQPYL
ncbi:MAG: hypothetical protein ACC650_02965, partial [Gammaproteobacteria bacterium]